MKFRLGMLKELLFQENLLFPATFARQSRWVSSGEKAVRNVSLCPCLSSSLTGKARRSQDELRQLACEWGFQSKTPRWPLLEKSAGEGLVDLDAQEELVSEDSHMFVSVYWCREDACRCGGQKTVWWTLHFYMSVRDGSGFQWQVSTCGTISLLWGSIQSCFADPDQQQRLQLLGIKMEMSPVHRAWPIIILWKM